MGAAGAGTSTAAEAEKPRCPKPKPSKRTDETARLRRMSPVNGEDDIGLQAPEEAQSLTEILRLLPCKIYDWGFWVRIGRRAGLGFKEWRIELGKEGSDENNVEDIFCVGFYACDEIFHAFQYLI